MKARPPSRETLKSEYSLLQYSDFWVEVALQLSTVNCQLSTVNCQLSTVNCQLSTVNCQLSTVNISRTQKVHLEKAESATVESSDKII
ncbi:MAG: hypothetical protein EAZ86_11715 [Oscillatoriales cyanobacterium]|nr:MAG: hypothetical protein EAZ86_11715 [Oscillatoriales cyanobacterium]